MPAAFLILSFLQPVGLHWLCAIVLGAPFTLLTPPPPLSLYPHPTSLSLYNPSRSCSIWFFSMGKIKKLHFSNDDFFCCCLTSKPRTPTHAPPPCSGVGSVYAPSAAQPSSVLLNFLNFHPLMNFIDLLPPPPTPLLCSSNCLDDNSPFHPQKPLWDCAMLADMIGFFLFVCLLLIIGDSSLRYK